jgi:hypothetical protein
MDRPRVERSGKLKPVGAVPAIERWSVICLNPLPNAVRLVTPHLRRALQWIATYLPVTLFGCSIIAWIWSVRGGGVIALTTPFVHPFGIHHREVEVRVSNGGVLIGTTGWFETYPGNLQTILGVRGYWPQLSLSRYQPDRHHFLSFIFAIQPGETALSPGVGVGKHRAIAFPLWTSTLIFGLLTWRSARRARIRHRQRCIDQQLCPECGYDMRASPDRCSECGWRAKGADKVTRSR